jgi:ubiquinone/menaquinone biosynthesis C-methylase UbiE
VPNPVSESVAKVRRRYDRLAPVYRAFLLLFALPPRARRAAVEALDLSAGGRVLEIGCGSGRNLPMLADAVGPSGRVYGVDVSTEMLDRAQRLIDRRQWSNVELRVEDAARLTAPDQLDGVLFGLSYAILPEPRITLEAAWRLLRPGGRLVIVEGTLPDNRLGRLLRRPMLALSRLTVLGNPDNRGWEDLAALSPEVQTRWLQFGTYYIASARKPG